MIRTFINVIFLGLIVVPIFILFAALYQNLIEVSRPKQKNRQRSYETQSYYTRPKETMSVRYKAAE